MLANRQAVKTSLRDLYRRHHVRSIEHYGALLRQTLAEIAPPGVSDPTIVLMTPGVYNSAFYEHMFLAQEMGVELVQGSDLLVHNGFVYMRTTEGLRRVDVTYRRIDNDFIDPLTFRPDSHLGTPGLFHAYQLGNVTIANAPGTGVADDKSVYAYVPDIIRYFLAEEPLLANVETHLCRELAGLEYTLDNLDRLVVKMVGESVATGCSSDRTRPRTSERRTPRRSGGVRPISSPSLPSTCPARRAFRMGAPRRVTSIFGPSSSTAARRALCREPSAASRSRPARSS